MMNDLITTLKTKVSKYLSVPLLVICSTCCVSAQPSVTTEYQVKAVFIFNFTQFIDWLPSSFAMEQSPLIIGVLGENPFDSYLEETVKGETANGHPLVVQYYKNMDNIDTCHILFINPHETNSVDSILSSLKGRNILTITNNYDNSEQEEVIRFFIRNHKTGFQINPNAAKNASLNMSSKLLNVAIIYVP